VTDSLKVLGRLDKRYADIVETSQEEDTKTSEEIIDTIRRKLSGSL